MTSMLGVARRAARRALEGAGFWFRRRDQLPYGVDFVYDVDRLSRAWGVSIEIIFDVGAHRGETIKQVLNSVLEAKVIAFEPHPETFAVLKEEFKDDARVSVHNLALDRETHAGQLYEYPLSTVSSLIPNARFASRYQREAVRILEVDCITLDEFCNRHGIRSIDLLKIDTEGYELNVLNGARGMLSSAGIRFVYLEFNDMLEQQGRTGGALVPIAEFLGPLGFRFIATYTDSVNTDGEMFVVSNALFALAPKRHLLPRGDWTERVQP